MDTAVHKSINVENLEILANKEIITPIRKQTSMPKITEDLPHQQSNMYLIFLLTLILICAYSVLKMGRRSRHDTECEKPDDNFYQSSQEKVSIFLRKTESQD